MNLPKTKTSPVVRRRTRELRQQMTPAEKSLWERLRNRQLAGLKLRRQCPIGPYVADFYCAQYRLVIEGDGGVHRTQVKADEQRSRRMAEYGYRMLRVRNEEVLTDPEGVLRSILAACQPTAESPLHECGEGQG
jgi:very-short-patch-repair endonuclease